MKEVGNIPEVKVYREWKTVRHFEAADVQRITAVGKQETYADDTCIEQDDMMRALELSGGTLFVLPRNARIVMGYNGDIFIDILVEAIR